MKATQRLFIACLIFSISFFMFTVPASADLVAHWALDETSGDTAYDSQGNYNGTIINSGYVAQGSAGIHGTAYTFSPRGGCIQTDSSYNIRSNDLTLSVLIKPVWAADTMYLITNRDPNGVQYTLDLRNNGTYRFRPTFSLYDGAWTGTELQAAEDIIAYDSWYHIAAVREGALMSIYVDGTLSASLTDSRVIDVNASTPFNLCDHGLLTSFYWGTMDDAGVWNEALDAYEISALYDIGIEKFEALRGGIESLSLGYTTEELDSLATLYDTQSGSLDIDGTTWTYLSGDLPGDIGGTTYDIGDSWVYGGKYYIKLGSGLEGAGGSVPELPPFAAQTLLLGFGTIGLLVKRVRG